MANETLHDRLPTPFPRDKEFGTWIDEHQAELDRLESEYEAVKESMQVAHATGEDLDALGSDYGQLGRRRGREDPAYSQYLQSLVKAYHGRGRKRDIKLAVTAGINADPDDVEITEDFSTLKYDITILGGAWKNHSTETIKDLAELANPIGVQLRSVEYQIPLGTAHGVASDTTSSTIGTNRLSSSDMANLSTTSGSQLY